MGDLSDTSSSRPWQSVTQHLVPDLGGRRWHTLAHCLSGTVVASGRYWVSSSLQHKHPLLSVLVLCCVSTIVPLYFITETHFGTLRALLTLQLSHSYFAYYQTELVCFWTLSIVRNSKQLQNTTLRKLDLCVSSGGGRRLLLCRVP
jgi:hypothetical protein